MEPPYFDKSKKNWDEYHDKLWIYLKKNIPQRIRTDKLRLDLIRKAYNQAFIAHKEVYRKGGNKEPYITHPVEVAIIIAKEMGYGTTTIAAALLHDVIEDYEHMDTDTFQSLFGDEISTIVLGVSKITNISGKKEKIKEQMEVFIKMILTIPQDFRTFLVKVADRLHNMRTMDDMPDVKRRIKSSENLFVYAPMAGIAGLWNIKNELEDRSFKFLYPEKYKEIKKLSDKFDPVLKTELENLKNDLAKFFSNNKFGITYEIFERRSLYKVMQKMDQENKPYEQIHNRFSLRVIMDLASEQGREAALSLFMKLPRTMLTGEAKDYYLKDNTIFNAYVFQVKKDKKIFEVQILTKEDHDVTIYGRIQNKKDFRGLTFLKRSIKAKWEEVTNGNFSLGSIYDNIYVKTPKNDIIELPQGSTVLDFAFKIHSDLGYHCIGAKTEKETLLPEDKLESGMQVEILTSDKIKPKESWLDYVRTPQAKRALKSYFAKYKTTKPIQIENGKIIVDDNVNFELATCCKPQIGEKTIGHISNNTVIIHKTSCNVLHLLQATDAQNIGEIEWKPINKKQARIARVEIKGIDKVGLLKEIVNVISNNLKINMKEAFFNNNDGIFVGHISLYYVREETLNKLEKRLTKIKYITEVKISK